MSKASEKYWPPVIHFDSGDSESDFGWHVSDIPLTEFQTGETITRRYVPEDSLRLTAALLERVRRELRDFKYGDFSGGEPADRWNTLLRDILEAHDG